MALLVSLNKHNIYSIPRTINETQHCSLELHHVGTNNRVPSASIQSVSNSINQRTELLSNNRSQTQRSRWARQLKQTTACRRTAEHAPFWLDNNLLFLCRRRPSGCIVGVNPKLGTGSATCRRNYLKCISCTRSHV